MLPTGATLETIHAEIAKLLSDDNNLEVGVENRGKKIIIPEGMSYDNAIKWIQRKKQEEEKTVAVYQTIPCFPLDGSIALMRALREIYGYVSVIDTPGFFGSTPPLLIPVSLADGKMETAIMGRVAIPKWEGGFLDIEIPGSPEIRLSGEVKRKFEPELKEIIALTKKFLEEQSIYKGQAIRLNLDWMAKKGEFHPVNDAPVFFDVNGVDDDSLILNSVTEFELRTNIFTLIERTKDCVSNGIPLKHGALLMGSFGTGKTLTAQLTARKCIDNKWTFIYLTNASDLANALRLAKLYAPCVVFAEDIDQAVSGGRTTEVNEILNVIDGVDTKNTPIITILSTNNAQVIEPAFLRAGRIDTVIKFEAPDAVTAQRFIRRFLCDDDGHSLLEEGADLIEAGKELAGFVPAFIGEAVQKAKRATIHRHGANIIGKVTANDLVLSAKALHKHVAMCNKDVAPTEAEKVFAAAKALGNAFNAEFVDQSQSSDDDDDN